LYQVFVVEAHPLLRDAFRDLVDEEEDMQVCGIAASGEEALEQLAGTPADVVVMDLSLRGMNGYELINRLRGLHPHLPCIVVSSRPAGNYQKIATALGAAAYVDKIELSETLVSQIRSLLV
jgi:DNA-binding NarL/FixJ family response regulator